MSDLRERLKALRAAKDKQSQSTPSLSGATPQESAEAPAHQWWWVSCYHVVSTDKQVQWYAVERVIPCHPLDYASLMIAEHGSNRPGGPHEDWEEVELRTFRALPTDVGDRMRGYEQVRAIACPYI